MGVKDYKISEHFNPNNPEIPSTYGCGYSEFETLRKLMTYVNSLYNAYLELNLSYSTMSETKEDSIAITNNRKLSPNGNFTGTWEGFRPSQVDVAITDIIDTNSSRLADIAINVKSFGAKGDYNGIIGTDNLNYFNLCVDSLPIEGGTIYIPKGDYLLSDTWYIDKENINIKLHPLATIRTNSITSNGGTVSFLGYKDFNIGTDTTPQRESCSFVGGTVINKLINGLDNGVSVARFKNALIANVNLPLVDRKAISCQYGVDNITIRNNNIGITTNNSITVETECKNIIIEHNVIDESNINGIHVTGLGINKCIIENNVINKTNGVGIYCGNSNEIVIQNNKIKNSLIGIFCINVSRLTLTNNDFDIISGIMIKCSAISNSLNMQNNLFINPLDIVIHMESCTTKPILIGNIIKGITHTYCTNAVNMSSFEPIMIGNIFITGTLGIFSGWNPKTFIGSIDGKEYILQYGKKIMSGNVIPTIGTYARGDTIINTEPYNNTYIGWVCVTQGTPGIWKGYGLIQA